MNRVILYGRVSQKSELRKTSNETPVINITIATGYGDKVTFVPVVCWGKQADMVNAYVDKGDRLAIEGHISSNKNTRNDQNIIEYKVTADMITLVETKKEKGNTIEPDFPKVDEPKNDDLPF